MRLPFRKVEPKKARKGPQAFIVTSTGGVHSIAALESAAISKDSQQVSEDNKWAVGEGLIAMPYEPSSFHFMYESSVPFFRTVNQIALDVSGTGYTLALKEGESENSQQHDRIMEFIEKPNNDLSFANINKRLLIDWGILGRWTMEVARNPRNEVQEVHHIRAGTVWHHKSKKKFAQKSGLKKTWFVKFGVKGSDGEPLSLNRESGDEEELGLNDPKRAHEIIAYDNYYPRSVVGVPNILPASGDLITSIGIRDYNLIFFENYGIPAYLVKLTGEWDKNVEEKDSTVKIVQDYFKELKGADKSHATLITKIPDDCSMEIEALSVDVKEGSFKILRTMSRDEILAAHSMPPYRIGIPVTGSLGGNVARELNENYNSGVVEPLQNETEHIWNNLIFPALFSEGENVVYELKWNNIDFTDENAESLRLNAQLERGQITPNQIRALHGQEPYAEGNKYWMLSKLQEVGEDVEGK